MPTRLIALGCSFARRWALHSQWPSSDAIFAPPIEPHTTDRRPTLANLSGPAPPRIPIPVSQSNVCSFYYSFLAFMVILLIANGVVNVAARVFYDVHCRMQNESCRRSFGHVRI